MGTDALEKRRRLLLNVKKSAEQSLADATAFLASGGRGPSLDRARDCVPASLERIETTEKAISEVDAELLRRK
jgi:hypothetical protein